MQKKYYTQKHSIYIQNIKGDEEFWFKQDKAGEIRPLAGGVHISRERLSELIKEYPSSLLDKTVFVDMDVEREFFEDAKREAFTGDIEKEKTVILFLVKRELNNYGIGYSSVVRKIKVT